MLLVESANDGGSALAAAPAPTSKVFLPSSSEKYSDVG